jgi:hypothetical protein
MFYIPLARPTAAFAHDLTKFLTQRQENETTHIRNNMGDKAFPFALKLLSSGIAIVRRLHNIPA